MESYIGFEKLLPEDCYKYWGIYVYRRPDLRQSQIQREQKPLREIIDTIIHAWNCYGEEIIKIVFIWEYHELLSRGSPIFYLSFVNDIVSAFVHRVEWELGSRQNAGKEFIWRIEDLIYDLYPVDKIIDIAEYEPPIVHSPLKDTRVRPKLTAEQRAEIEAEYQAFLEESRKQKNKEEVKSALEQVMEAETTSASETETDDSLSRNTLFPPESSEKNIETPSEPTPLTTDNSSQSVSSQNPFENTEPDTVATVSVRGTEDAAISSKSYKGKTFNDPTNTLATVMKKHSLSSAELATRVGGGITGAHIRAVCLGRELPKVHLIIMLCGLYGVDLDKWREECPDLDRAINKNMRGRTETFDDMIDRLCQKHSFTVRCSRRY